jgi:hypothetical protein
MYAHHRSHAGLDGRLRHHKATWRAFFVSEVTLILAVGQSREQEQRGHLRWWCAGAAVVLVYHRLSCQCSAPGEFCALLLLLETLNSHIYASSTVSHLRAVSYGSESFSDFDRFPGGMLVFMLAMQKGVLVYNVDYQSVLDWHGEMPCLLQCSCPSCWSWLDLDTPHGLSTDTCYSR